MAVATLLPNGEQQFCDSNGAPYAGGSVYFYIPATTTPKITWQDAGETTPNTNPVILDSAGRAIIYGSGQYRQVLFDSLGNEVWDQLTQDIYSLIDQGAAIWGGTATGTANALVLTSSPAITALATGQLIAFIAASNNTNAVTADISGIGPIAVVKVSSSGLIPLISNNICAGGRYLLLYDGTSLVLLNPTENAISASFLSVASATTTDLGAVGSNNITVTGSTTITSFGASASISNPLYNVVFSGSLTITNGADISTPNGQNIITQAGDYAIMQYNGTGAWTVLNYFPATTGYIGSINIVQLTSTSGTYFPSSNLVYLTGEMTGGGGGSGGSAAGGNGSPSAGSAGYLKILLTAAQVGASVAYTIGAGGAGGAGASNTTGANGGNTTFGPSLTASGGSGTTGDVVQYIAGGSGGSISASLGQIILSMTGQAGGAISLVAGNPSGIGIIGDGGSNPLGFGGPAQSASLNTPINGGVGTGYGAGASGSSGGGAGGSGQNGIIIITEYLFK